MNLSSFLSILYVVATRADSVTTDLPGNVADRFSSDNTNIMRAGLAPHNDAVLEEQLYTSIIIGEYESALATTILMHNNLQGHIISQVITRLIRDRKAKTMEYAYTIWTFSKPIAEHYFPVQFNWIFNKNYVELINRRYGVRLGVKESAGTNVTGSMNTWELIPLWETNRISFKIHNIASNLYLYLDTHQHVAKAWHDNNVMKYLWYLQPVRFENDLLFFIYNRELNDALEFIKGDGGVLEIHVTNNNIHDNPDKYGWFIVPL